MSCGGKLEDLAPQASVAQEESAAEPNKAAEIEFDDDLERGKSNPGAQSAGTESEKEGEVEIDFGIEAEPEEGDPGEQTLKVHTAEPQRRPRTTIEIQIEDEKQPDKPEPELDLEFENKVREQQKKQKEQKEQKERRPRITLEDIESEKSSGDFITKWDVPKEVLKEATRKPEKS